GLSEVGLNAEETHGQTDSGRDACVQLPSVHVLSLHISAVQDSVSFPNADLTFAAEIDKHMVTNFSGLDLHLSTKGHVFGAFVHVQPISSRTGEQKLSPWLILRTWKLKASAGKITSLIS
uniref:Uncharacterized protein n=1 Tax=Aegilops tauschii subsp. strangulata TaxID=200361 RepID=A0A453CZE8_AEGTS